MSKTVSLPECFADLHDPRREHGRFHDLWDIVALTICAVVAARIVGSTWKTTATASSIGSGRS